MSKIENSNPLGALSDAMVAAVDRAGASTITVDARRRFPASGVAYSENLVLTADHVVEHDEDIQIGLPDGTRLAARVAGRDSGSDLALLRLDASSLVKSEPVTQPARVGQLALALGRPSGEGIQASLGVVSAVGGPLRTGRGGLLESYLRTDTIPYPGFSGGPLVDVKGRILGINTSGLTRGGALTIPAGLSWEIAATLAEHGSVRRGFLGIRSQPVEIAPAQRKALGREQSTGLLVVGVEEDSPAGKGGLLVGDILVGMGGKLVSDPDELLTMLVGKIVGQSTDVEILRGGQPQKIKVRVGERT